MILRTGIDLVEIDRLENLSELIRTRFEQRIYTPQEIEDSGGNMASLAGRFAVKEAVSKALGSGIGEVSWQEIEVVRAGSGEPNLVLHGNARRLAEQAGLTSWSISISHTKTHAVAMAVALGEGPGL
ncbi:MAG TPA: holo-ACP synthase [Anaerolineaceae bacterium]|nr:holo-ACP synthase [Anaerolineaceae bacterium]